MKKNNLKKKNSTNLTQLEVEARVKAKYPYACELLQRYPADYKVSLNIKKKLILF